MFILNQPLNGMLGKTLQKWLRDNTGQFICFSAFAKNSGVLMIEQALETFKSNGGKSSFYIGIDLYGTSVEALKNIFRLADNLYIVHSENQITYHPKMYYLFNEHNIYFSIGSNNLTKGGLFNNHESSLIIEEKNNFTNKHLKQIDTDINSLIDYFELNKNNTVLHVKSVEDIDELEKKGYIKKEKELHISNTNIINSENVQKAFGSEKISVHAQHTSPTIGEKDVSTEGGYLRIENDIFWFEAGKLTGGSKNQIDLSKTGKIQSGSTIGTIYERNDNPNEIAKGGISYFGLNPDVPDEKEITINYDGKNFSPATIKYTPGNKNWRLQIKGMNNERVKITEVIGNDMIDQILLFEKVSDDTYILNIVRPSKLEILKNKSLFWATNGRSRNGRKYGYIIKELEV